MQDLTWHRLRKEAEQHPKVTAAGIASVLFLGYVAYMSRTRLRTSKCVPQDMLGGRGWVRGYVAKVEDGDDFRLYHTPGFGWMWPIRWFRMPSFKNMTPEMLREKTIRIRIGGIDAPEAPPGLEPQPGAKKSLKWLTRQVEGKFVYCQFYERDMYGRIVATVYFKRRWFDFAPGDSVALAMLRAGQATVYDLKGAVYGDEGLAEYRRAEEEAQRQKKGIWKNGTDIETPAEYKQRMRGQNEEK